MMKIARLTELRRRLRSVLVDTPDLADAFERALVHHDERALGDAFEKLHRTSDGVRRDVEAVIVDWLFDPEGEINLANVASATSSSYH